MLHGKDLQDLFPQSFLPAKDVTGTTEWSGNPALQMNVRS
jgi:hypothetical protein